MLKTTNALNVVYSPQVEVATATPAAQAAAVTAAAPGHQITTTFANRSNAA